MTFIFSDAPNNVVVPEDSTTVVVAGELNTVVPVDESIAVTSGSGIQGAVGAGGALGYYGSFYDTSTQTNLAAANVITINSTTESNQVSIIDGSKITFNYEGTYNLQFSAQFDKTDAGDDLVEIWLSKNGTDVPWSNTIISLHGNDGKSVPSWNFVLTLAAGDYLQLKWYSADSNMRLLAVNPTTRPGIPSVIVTATQVMYTQGNTFNIIDEGGNRIVDEYGNPLIGLNV